MRIVLSFAFALTCILGLTSAVDIPDKGERRIMPFRIVKSEVDTQMSIKQCRVLIDFNFGSESPEEQVIYMSINGLLENVNYSSGQKAIFDLTPGKYVFKIWGGPGYQEIVTDSIEFKAQTVNDAEAIMYRAETEIKVLKPVLYFHSDQEREFSLNVIPANDFTFTYPAIGSGWKGKIHTNGSLTINNKNYPYLFWEAEQKYAFKPSSNGYHLKKEEYVSFLEKKCEELGFNATERTDFITFWGMKMQNHDELFVQFLFDESCDQFGKLEFDEKPDVFRRVYIMISPWNSYFSPYLKDIPFETIPASSYSVLEWGGYEFEIEQNTFTANYIRR